MLVPQVLNFSTSLGKTTHLECLVSLNVRCVFQMCIHLPGSWLPESSLICRQQNWMQCFSSGHLSAQYRGVRTSLLYIVLFKHPKITLVLLGLVLQRELRFCWWFTMTLQSVLWTVLFAPRWGALHSVINIYSVYFVQISWWSRLLFTSDMPSSLFTAPLICMFSANFIRDDFMFSSRSLIKMLTNIRPRLNLNKNLLETHPLNEYFLLTITGTF